MDKEQLKQELSKLTKEELLALLVDNSEPEEKDRHTINPNKRRGKGTRKKSQQQPKIDREKSIANTHTISDRTKSLGNNSSRRAKTESIEGVQHTNKFEDLIKRIKPSAAEEKELELAKKDDKINIIRPPTERDRQDERILVKCRVCGVEELVSPSLIYSPKRYKCNECSTQAV